MMRIECDGVLFDLDGVLIDSTACIERHWQQWAQQHGLDMDRLMQVAHGRRTIDTIRLVAPHLCAEEEARHFAAAEASDTQGVMTIEGAAALLSSLPAHAWAIATSGTRDVATARLRHAGLPVPDILVTADDVAYGKPHPEPYLAAASGLGLPADRCVVVEDSPAGIAAAGAAGIPAVAIAATHAHHDLAGAAVIARRLGDIRIAKGSSCRLALWIAGDALPAQDLTSLS